MNAHRRTLELFGIFILILLMLLVLVIVLQAPATASPVQIPLHVETCRTYSKDANLTIPWNDPVGVTSTMGIGGGGYLVNLTVSFTVTHGYPEDFVGYLCLPWGKCTLFNQDLTGGSGTSSYTFNDSTNPPIEPIGAQGHKPAGVYALHIADVYPYEEDSGTLDSWALTVCTEPAGTPAPTATITPSPTPTVTPNPTTDFDTCMNALQITKENVTWDGSTPVPVTPVTHMSYSQNITCDNPDHSTVGEPWTITTANTNVCAKFTVNLFSQWVQTGANWWWIAPPPYPGTLKANSLLGGDTPYLQFYTYGIPTPSEYVFPTPGSNYWISSDPNPNSGDMQSSQVVTTTLDETRSNVNTARIFGSNALSYASDCEWTEKNFAHHSVEQTMDITSCTIDRTSPGCVTPTPFVPFCRPQQNGVWWSIW